jgi:hypothetical protein
MHALVIYESMYGNTHVIADHIAEGLRTACEVSVMTVGAATPELLADADLIVCGGPTHVHTMSSERSRNAAADAAEKEGSGLTLEPDANGPGLRDWFKSLDLHAAKGAAFDTRIDAPALLTGRASKGIAKRLQEAGVDLLMPPESFLVDKQNHLIEVEAERAEAWGAALAKVAAQTTVAR